MVYSNYKFKSGNIKRGADYAFSEENLEVGRRMESEIQLSEIKVIADVMSSVWTGLYIMHEWVGLIGKTVSNS